MVVGRAVSRFSFQLTQTPQGCGCGYHRPLAWRLNKEDSVGSLVQTPVQLGPDVPRGLWLSVGWREEDGTSFLIPMSPAWQGQICRGLPSGDQAAESLRPSRICTSGCDEVPCRPVTLLACFPGSPTAPQTRCTTRCSRTSPRASTVRAWSATPSSAPSGKWSVGAPGPEGTGSGT